MRADLGEDDARGGRVAISDAGWRTGRRRAARAGPSTRVEWDQDGVHGRCEAARILLARCREGEEAATAKAIQARGAQSGECEREAGRGSRASEGQAPRGRRADRPGQATAAVRVRTYIRKVQTKRKEVDERGRRRGRRAAWQDDGAAHGAGAPSVCGGIYIAAPPQRGEISLSP